MCSKEFLNNLQPFYCGCHLLDELGTNYGSLEASEPGKQSR